MKSDKRTTWLFVLPVIALAAFFTLLYYMDNKYQTPPPYGSHGIITLSEADLSRQKPLFLIDGWLLTDARVTDQPTYIGEFSNLQRGDMAASPHGKAAYRLTLRYHGDPLEVSISFPQLYAVHSISLDNRVLSQGNGGARFSFTLTPGDHLLTVETVSQYGYYSGMYHPPMLAVTEKLFSALLIQCIAYGLAFFSPLALALYTLVLWRSSKDRAAFWFGLLCCSFSLYLSYYFVRLLSLPFESSWFLPQSAAFYVLCFCVIRLTALAGGEKCQKDSVRIGRIQAAASALLLLLALLIPFLTWVVRLHGYLADLYDIFVFCSVLLLALRSGKPADQEHRFLLFSCTVFGAGLLLNLFFSNRCEPILFFWQFEWCGLFLVVLFGAMMAARNKRILAENEVFSNHLETLVQKRTKELENLLQERKTFFSDMAHDLKAPIFATKAFIQAIRENDTGANGELTRYIDEVEAKQQEMALRVQGLTVFNQIEDVTQPKEPVSVRKLLKEVYELHHMAAEVASVYLTAELPDTDGFLFAQPRKMHILFENLIFNALRATPCGGRITLSAELEDGECHFRVADTGTGIPLQELPHIFERFYVGNENKAIGSGLGLAIVKSIVEELDGEICVSSRSGQGTVFYIDLPLSKEQPEVRQKANLRLQH